MLAVDLLNVRVIDRAPRRYVSHAQTRLRNTATLPKPFGRNVCSAPQSSQATGNAWKSL
jgi:hypothetical protein